MSVLQGLKGTFKGVQQDIVDGLKALTSFEGHPKTDTLKKLRGDGVHLDAGADLLYRYQKTWEDIDQNNKENARQAKVVDDKVNDIFKSWEKQAEVMTKLEDSVQHVPDLLQVLSQLTQTLSEVKEEFKKVEDALDELEDVCDEEELQRQMMSHTLQLQQYQQTRYSDVEKVKVTLAKEHAKRMQEIERDRSEKLQERQNAFEEAFTNDLSFYKQHGRADKLELPEISKVASLSEITIEQDQTALDDFLASQTTTPLTDTGPDASIEEVKDDEEEEDEDGDVIVRDAEDLGEEGTFIEDDYTEDFSNSETSGLQDELSHLHAKLEHNDISYRSTFDTDSVEREVDRDKVSHLTTKDETTHLTSKDETTHLTSKDETTQLSTKDETTHLTSKDETTQLKTKDEMTHLKTKDETTHLKTKDEKTHLTTKDETTHPTKKDETTHQITKDETTHLTTKDETTRMTTKDETTRLTIKDEITDDVKDKPNTDKDSGCDSPNPNNVQENESITGKDSSRQADNDDNDQEDSSITITDDVQSSDTKEESDKVETNSEISQDCDSKTGHSQTGHSENRDSKNDDS